MGQDFITKDSGEHKEYSTGAKRDTTAGKGAYVLLPPTVILRDAQLYERGQEKYDARNWEKGIPSSRFMDALLRHAFQYLEGQRDEDHLAAVRFNAAGIMYNEEMIERGRLDASLHDLPNYSFIGTVERKLLAELRYGMSVDSMGYPKV